MIPGIATREVNLEDARESLKQFAALDAVQATGVVRAARLFRQALWVADEDGELAWLLMVSAVETAAALWHPQGAGPEVLIQDQNPDLADLLLRAGGEELLAEALPLMNLNRPTAATQSFLVQFGSQPPMNRPDEWAQLDFTKLKKAVQLIYKYRSQVLHAGTPWPGPMLEQPFQGDMTAPAEVPLGLWSQYGSHTIWMAKDVPMHFHTFAGIVQRSLLAWLKLSSKKPPMLGH